jgi:hypothetical protein
MDDIDRSRVIQEIFQAFDQIKTTEEIKPRINLVLNMKLE